MKNATASKLLMDIAGKFRTNERTDIAIVLTLMSCALDIGCEMAIFTNIVDNVRTPLDEKLWESRVELARSEGRVEGANDVIDAIRKAIKITDDQMAEIWPDSIE